MTSQDRWPVAIIGTRDTGTDLMTKILRSDGPLDIALDLTGERSCR